ncbi:hypothetical protein KJK76_001703 [Campylobacter jejuni]|nr:hypothetical protein [Campylobacter jejuni]EHN6916846.1 hypothetical protein [Campylobacter jejuni]
MLPWLIGAAAVAAGKFIYDKLSDDSDDDYESSSSTQDRQREKERENKQAKYEKIIKEYQTKLKNLYEAECIVNTKDRLSLTHLSSCYMSPLKFKKSKKLDDIQKDIKNLKKDMDALWEINMYAKSLIKEENETSVK